MRAVIPPPIWVKSVHLLRKSLGDRAATFMCFEDPNSRARVELRNPCAWTLLFGPFYWARHGALGEGLVATVLTVFSAGLAWLVLPFFAVIVLRRRYLSNGWRELE